MKRLVLSLGALSILLFSLHAVSGEALRTMGNLGPGVTQPDSLAFGKSLNAWMEAYIRWLENGAVSNHSQKSFFPNFDHRFR
jgi:hypothetical protein